MCPRCDDEAPDTRLWHDAKDLNFHSMDVRTHRLTRWVPVLLSTFYGPEPPDPRPVHRPSTDTQGSGERLPEDTHW